MAEYLRHLQSKPPWGPTHHKAATHGHRTRLEFHCVRRRSKHSEQVPTQHGLSYCSIHHQKGCRTHIVCSMFAISFRMIEPGERLLLSSSLVAREASR